MTERIAVVNSYPIPINNKKKPKNKPSFCEFFIMAMQYNCPKHLRVPLGFFTRSCTKMCIVREDTTPLIIPTYDPDWIMSHLSERERIKTRTTKL